MRGCPGCITRLPLEFKINLFLRAGPCLPLARSHGGDSSTRSAAVDPAGREIGEQQLPFGCSFSRIEFIQAIFAGGAVPAFFLVEGKGFGADSSSSSPSSSDIEDNDDEEAGYEDDDGGHATTAASTRDDPEAAGANADAAAEDQYGAPGALPLSRTTTVSSAAVSDSEPEPDIGSPPLSASLPRHRPHVSRDSTVRAGGRSVRRRTSVPIGMGTGFRRHSSNLGMSRDGYGTGQSFGG